MKLSPEASVYVTGHRGMVGSAMVRCLEGHGFGNILTRTRAELDLCNQQAVFDFLAEQKPEAVIVAAAKVGGIHANNTYPAEFLYENLAIAANLVEGAYRAGVGRLLFLGSSCIYPREVAQPMREDALLTATLEPTNEAYAVAKIAGLKLCQYYRKQHGCHFHSAMPTNLYGPGDNYHPENSHVLPGLIRRFHEAKLAGDAQVAVWGSGKPMREFLHVDDLAEGLFHLANLDNPPNWVNVGSGSEISIADLAALVKEVIGFEGELVFDPSRPDGTPRKLMDNSLIESTGWKAQIPLREGIERTYQDFLKEAGRRS